MGDRQGDQYSQHTGLGGGEDKYEWRQLNTLRKWAQGFVALGMLLREQQGKE